MWWKKFEEEHPVAYEVVQWTITAIAAAAMIKAYF